MAQHSVWIRTELPEKIVEIIEEEYVSKYENNLSTSVLAGDHIDLRKRNSKNTWIPTTNWVGGMIWYYIQRANRENFLYDINYIESETMQYTRYNEGEFYGWHNDTGIQTHYSPISGQNITNQQLCDNFVNEKSELIRKLSFSLQLSAHDEYEGGNLQILDDDGKTYFTPRARGTLIIFDSRAQHRVLKVKKGIRRSLVGWVVGPRWK